LLIGKLTWDKLGSLSSISCEETRVRWKSYGKISFTIIDTYDDMEFCAETSITLPTHSALPLRETIYILSDIEREIRTIVGTTTEHIHGSRNITLDRGSEHTVYFSGVPEAFTDLFRDQENLREQLEKERCDEKGTPYREPICTCWKCVVQGRKYGPGCQCCNCVLDDSDEEQEGEEGYDSDDDFEYKPYRTIFVDEEITSEEVESVVKRAPKAFRKRWGGREPKWARKVDISIDDDDDLEL
jgi:hypothetical protein